MAAELTGGSELTKLVSNHVFSDVNRNKFVSVVHCYSVTDEVGRNHRSAGPCLDYGLLATLIHGENLVLKVYFDIWTLL